MNLSWLLPSVKGIPVLMYHKVWPGINDALTITPEKLEEQWQFLKRKGYHAISLGDFLSCVNDPASTYPPKSILLTFDDGYLNNYEYVYPLLQKMHWQATFFIIADTLQSHIPGRPDAPDTRMTVKELSSLDPQVVQLAMHGYHHEHFDKLSEREIGQVMQRSIEAFDKSGLAYEKVLAYPYGSRPRDGNASSDMKKWFGENGIKAAFRIGNQVCKIPTADRYELKRIDIKGTDSNEEVLVKLVKGKLKPF